MMSLKRNSWLALPPVVLCLVATQAAWPQSAPQPSPEALQAARTACADDLQKFCAGVQPGGGRILACLKQNREQLSSGCKQAGMSLLQGAGGAAAGPSSAGAMPAMPAPATAASPVLSPLPSTASGGATNASAGPASAAPVSSAKTGSGGPGYFKLKRLQASLKEGSVEKQKVFSMLAPEDWTMDGGFHTNPNTGTCFSDMIQVQGLVKSPDSTHLMAVVPRSSFRWADDPAARRQMEDRDRQDLKYKLVGCPIKAPMHAVDFLRQELFPKFHKDAPQLTSEPFPELEQLVRGQLGLGPQGDGSTRIEAVRVRTTNSDANGQPIDEVWSAAIVVRTFPVAARGLGYEWSAENVTVMEVPKGHLDSYDKLYRVMATSVRLDPQFEAWVNGQTSKLSAALAESLRQQSVIIAQFQQHVADTINSVTANQMRGAAQSAHGADQLVRGVQTFRDPSTGRSVELSNQYDHAWSNGNDQYIVSDDPNFNPNGRVNGDWGSLELVRPQP